MIQERESESESESERERKKSVKQVHSKHNGDRRYCVTAAGERYEGT